MPDVYRDPETGAKLFKKSKLERKLDICLKKISLLEKKIERLEEILGRLPLEDDLK